jgi:hypothetical protein
VRAKYVAAGVIIITLTSILLFALLIMDARIGSNFQETVDISQVTPLPDGQLCWDQTQAHDALSWEELVANPPFDSGLGFGVGKDDIPNATMIGSQTFQLAPDTPHNINFRLFYPHTEKNNEPITLHFIIIVNETQLLDAIDEKERSTTLQPGDEAVLDIKLPPLTAGYHEIVILGVLDSKDLSHNIERAAPVVYRASLVTEAQPNRSPLSYTKLSATVSRGPNGSMYELLLSLEPSTAVWDYPIPVSSEEHLNFYINAGYTYILNTNAPDLSEPSEARFALLLFLNHKQINVSPDAEVIYGTVANDTAYARIPVVLTAPKEPGRYDILAVRINNPRVPYCILVGPPDGYIFPFEVRVESAAIDVINSE